MYSTRSNESSNAKSQLHSQRVIDLLAYHVGGKITSTDEKNELVLVIGRAGTGKSVLVNILCGTKFYFDENDSKIKSASSKEVIVQIGDEDKSCFDCTVFPRVYRCDAVGGYIMDTPGFLEMDELDLKVVKEQAIRLGVQQASKVKIVFLVSCKDLDGIQEMSRTFVSILGSICVRDVADVPIYFLVNKFEITTKMAKKISSMTSEEINEYLLQEIQGSIIRVAGAIERQCTILNERLEKTEKELKASGLSDGSIQNQLQNDPTSHEMNKTLKTLSCLKNALENKYFGYFDPLNPYFVDKTVQSIRDMHSVGTISFDFAMYQNEWLIAKRWLEEELLKYKKWLAASKISKLYPKAFFDDGAIALSRFISEKYNDLNDLKNKENIKTLTEKYDSDIGSRIKRAKNEIDSMKAEIKKLNEERAKMESNQVVLYEERWNKANSFTDFWSYTVTYPLSKSQGYPVDIPIIKRTIEISEPTYILQDKYEPEKAVSVTKFRSVPEDAVARAIIESIFSDMMFAYFRYKQYAEGIKKHVCKGTVTFYGKESDKEWAAYTEKRNRINALNNEIAKKEQELKELNETIEKSIEKKIQSSIDASERQKADLSSLHKDIIDKMSIFPKEVQCASFKDGEASSINLSFMEKLTMIYNLCKALTSETGNTESIKTFIAMYDELQELEKQSSHITPTLENIPQLCREMRIEMNKCNETTPEIPLQQQQVQQQAHQLPQKQQWRQWR